MARWLQVQLSGGSINGEAIFAPGLVAGTHLPRVELDAEFYTYKRHHYGYGWYQADYDGMVMYHHFGSFSGYRSNNFNFSHSLFDRRHNRTPRFAGKSRGFYS